MKNCIKHSVNPLLCGALGILSEGHVLRLRNESPKLHHARVHVELVKGLNDSKMAHNADGYGKWANLPISNDKGFDHLLYPMLCPPCGSLVFSKGGGC